MDKLNTSYCVVKNEKYEMFKQIYYGLKSTENRNTYEYRLLTGQYLAPANPIKLLLIRYITFVWGRLDRIFENRKNEQND